MEQIARNEQLKLTANVLDRVSSTFVTLGVLAPVAAAIYTGAQGPGPLAVVISVVIWLLCALALHLGARTILRGLK